MRIKLVTVCVCLQAYKWEIFCYRPQNVLEKKKENSTDKCLSLWASRHFIPACFQRARRRNHDVLKTTRSSLNAKVLNLKEHKDPSGCQLSIQWYTWPLKTSKIITMSALFLSCEGKKWLCDNFLIIKGRRGRQKTLDPVWKTAFAKSVVLPH